MTEAEIWSLEPRAIEELVRREPDFAVAAVDYTLFIPICIWLVRR